MGMKQALYDAIDGKAEVLTALSDQIWEYAELSMAEHRSAQAYLQVLKQEGFTLRENLCGMATAFSGSFGTGKPVIGLLGEYDALSGLSQAPGVARPAPLQEGGCGQGCGHNLLGAGSLGAAIAIKELIKAGKLTGTVIFYGCPGEEGCAGKAFMAREGLFRELDAALCWHPGDTNEVTVGSNAACLQVEYTFTGLAAHAAGDPYNGRSALDAAELMNVGVQFLREHMPPNSSVHYSFSNSGGISPNVVQPTAALIYMVRGQTVRKAKALLKRVDDIAKGAALMTGTTVTSRQLDGTSNTLSNPVLEQLLYENLCAAPMATCTRQELAFAQALKDTFVPGELPGLLTEQIPQLKALVEEKTQGGTRPINDFVVPYYPAVPFSPGSTDVGDVSWLTPTAQFTAAAWPSGCPGHSWQIVSIGKEGQAHKALLYAAKVLSGAVAELMTDPALLQRVKESFALAAKEGYDCPLGPEVIAAPQASL